MRAAGVPNLDPPASVDHRPGPGTVPAEDDHRYGRGHQEAPAHHTKEMAKIVRGQETAENFSRKPQPTSFIQPTFQFAYWC